MDELWPSADYAAQIERLRAAVGQQVYLIELHGGKVNLGVSVTGEAFELLAVLDYPRPDPARGILPHLLLLDDGRGVNLGRIARVSTRPFAPQTEHLLYRDTEASDKLLFAEQRLSKNWIAQRSRQLLARVLGKPEPPLLEDTGPAKSENRIAKHAKQRKGRKED
ncbi:MAG: hypothetical protein H7842_06655 [Gammaproteobacteria bacterium SHHR-1]|uniref:hypothetical protein n=1 Tax=Magnetovirga frankeli TaxID=947516 RepID=UPI001292DF47|nr:hypothetical protein D5125_01975 [gamma proteobacterium SS-5]